MTTKQNNVWTRKPSVSRAGKFFYVASHGGNTVTVLSNWDNGRWEVRYADRILPATWANVADAKYYAEQRFEFGRFAVRSHRLPKLNEMEQRILNRLTGGAS